MVEILSQIFNIGPFYFFTCTITIVNQIRGSFLLLSEKLRYHQVGSGLNIYESVISLDERTVLVTNS